MFKCGECNHGNKNYFRYYECGECNIEILKIDLNVETENIETESVEVNNLIYRYTISNSGTKDLFGDILIYSEIFGNIREHNVYLKDFITIERIGEDKDEKARAYFKVKNLDLWVYSEEIKVGYNLLISNISLQNNLNNLLLEDECYVFAVINTVGDIFGPIPGFSACLRFSNTGNIDAQNVKVIVSFDSSVTNITVLDNLDTPYTDFILEDRKLIFSFPVLLSRQSRIFNILFTSLFPDFNSIFEVITEMDTSNGYKNITPVVGIIKNVP